VSQNRFAWVVDAAYLLNACEPRFDYLRLRHVLEAQCGEPFVEAYYLNSSSSQNYDPQDAFHSWLKTAPPHGPQMRVKLYKLKHVGFQCDECGMRVSKQVQKGVDVGIATLSIKMAVQNRYDTLLLSAGDGDFEDAVQFIREELNKSFWLAGFNGTISPDLQSYADRVIWLDDMVDQFRKD
jgi:uncharacterized LabA/DUF88 family protein